MRHRPDRGIEAPSPRSAVVALPAVVVALALGFPVTGDAAATPGASPEPPGAAIRGQQGGQGDVEAALRRGTRAMSSGDVEAAIRAFREALEASPGHPLALTFYGSALLEAGRPGEALEPLRKAVGAAPRLFPAQHNLGLALMANDLPGEAVAPLRRALEIRPEDAAARLNLGRALSRAGRPDEALPHFEAVIDAHPDAFPAHRYRGAALLELGRYREALEALERAGELDPGHPQVVYARALALRELGEHARAAEELRDLIRARPDDADAWLLLGRVLSEQEKDLDATVSAVDALQRALELRPGERAAVLGLAELYRKLGLYDEALAVLEEYRSRDGVEADPELELKRGRVLALLGRTKEARRAYARAAEIGDDPRAHYRLGLVAKRQADLAGAVEAFEAAIARRPRFAAARRQLAEVLVDRRRFQRALEVLGPLVDEDPDDPGARYLTGLAHLRAGRPEAATPHLRRALELDPDDASAAYNLAIALRQQGEAEESRAVMQRFKALSDRQEGGAGRVEQERAEVATLNRQGLYHYRRGEPRQAVESFEKALGLDPEAEVVHINLGLARAALGDHAAAAGAFEAAVELGTERPEVYAALADEYEALGRMEDARRMRERYRELRDGGS